MKKIVIFIFILVFICNLILSIGRTGLNISKIFTEEAPWLAMSLEEKKQKIYGDLYYGFQYVRSIHKNNMVYVLSKDGKAYYLGRYFLYPIRIYWIQNKKDLDRVTKGATILIYHPDDFDISGKSGVARLGDTMIYQSK